MSYVTVLAGTPLPWPTRSKCSGPLSALLPCRPPSRLEVCCLGAAEPLLALPLPAHQRDGAAAAHDDSPLAACTGHVCMSDGAPLPPAACACTCLAPRLCCTPLIFHCGSRCLGCVQQVREVSEAPINQHASLPLAAHQAPCTAWLQPGSQSRRQNHEARRGEWQGAGSAGDLQRARC